MDVLVEGLSLEIPIYVVTEGDEPPFFTRFFSWDHSKANVSLLLLPTKLSLIIHLINYFKWNGIVADYWQLIWEKACYSERKSKKFRSKWLPWKYLVLFLLVINFVFFAFSSFYRLFFRDIMVIEAVLLPRMAMEEVVHLYLGVQAQVIGFFRALLPLPRNSLKNLLPIAVLVTRNFFINLWFEIYLDGYLAMLTICIIFISLFFCTIFFQRANTATVWFFNNRTELIKWDCKFHSEGYKCGWWISLWSPESGFC